MFIALKNTDTLTVRLWIIGRASKHIHFVARQHAALSKNSPTLNASHITYLKKSRQKIEYIHSASVEQMELFCNCLACLMSHTSSQIFHLTLFSRLSKLFLFLSQDSH